LEISLGSLLILLFSSLFSQVTWECKVPEVSLELPAFSCRLAACHRAWVANGFLLLQDLGKLMHSVGQILLWW